MLRRTILFSAVLSTLLPAAFAADEFKPTLRPLVRVVDLDVGESADVTLCDGSEARIKLLDLRESLDSVTSAVRKAEVTVDVNGQRVTLVSATYHLPTTVGEVQIDCSITKGYNEKGRASSWGLEKAARLRLWPAGSPWVAPGTFGYPVKQKWFATDTQMANDPVFVDGGERADKTSVYYHSGLDFGGSEGMVDVVAATDGLVVAAAESVLDGYKQDTPVSPRYDVVYLLDSRGWYYRYSHLKTIDKSILPGRVVKMGDPIGVLGKEGGSGGWSHLHFEIKSRQPSGLWGTQEGYAFLWQAYRQQHDPKLIAVSRPHHLIWTGETVTLDATKSWSASDAIVSYEWRFEDGSTAAGPTPERTYNTPGQYSEILKVTDTAGQVAYDFAVVIVYDRDHPERIVPTVHANYVPTLGIRVGEPITFKARSFNVKDATEVWDFRDGSPRVKVHSDGNAVKHAPDGYAVTTHRFQKAGDYVVRVESANRFGVKAVGHLHVQVLP